MLPSRSSTIAGLSTSSNLKQVCWVTSSTLKSLEVNSLTSDTASERASSRTEFINIWNRCYWELRSIKAGSCIKQSSRNGFCLFLSVADSLFDFVECQPSLFWLWLQSYSSSANCFGVLLSPLFTVDFILQLVFCHSYLISSSVPNKEFNLFSLSQRLRRELIAVYRHLSTLTV